MPGGSVSVAPPSATGHFTESMTALTDLRDEERLFFDTVSAFARERIAPLVREMDEKAHFDARLLPELFQLGVMGVEIPSEQGGAGRRPEYAGRKRAAALGQRGATGPLLPEAGQ